jgi:SGNH hydrolase-like domain, acetyltransferase AlgX
MRTLDKIFVCLYLAIAVLPATAMVRKWRDHRLDGAIQPEPRPALAFDAVRSEAYQTGFARWFEQRLGLRNWSIWIDNTLLFHLFGETKFAAHVAVGRDGVLFERDDLTYFNRPPAELPAPGAFEALADRIAAMQQRLQRQGRGLVPVFVPSKTTFYPDKVSALWTRDIGMPRPSTERVYRAMKRALDERHVVYVDGIEMLLTSKEPRDLLWGPAARHYSLYTGCLVVRETLARYAELARVPAIDYPCQVDVRPSDRRHSDLDLFRLLNVWLAPRDPLGRETRHDPMPAAPLAEAPRTLWISTSFGWTMMGDAGLSKRFREMHLDYYRSLVHDGITGETFDAKQRTEHWRAIYPTRDLYVLEMFEVYLTPTYFGLDAITALEEELGDSRPPASGR